MKQQRPLTKAERDTIRQKRDEQVRASLPKDAMGRTIIPRDPFHRRWMDG